VLRGVVETIVPTAAAQQLKLDVEPIPPLKIRADPRRLEQVFLNLLGNAVKFTPQGGRIGIAVHERPGSVEVRVSDTGEGIEPSFLPHMFDAFRQADTPRRAQGVGLGLAIARELVEAHKGQIAAESDGMGRGSTFVVTLPTAEPAMPAETVH
jgi:signal transduction histidine kinase